MLAANLGVSPEHHTVHHVIRDLVGLLDFLYTSRFVGPGLLRSAQSEIPA